MPAFHNDGDTPDDQICYVVCELINNQTYFSNRKLKKEKPTSFHGGISNSKPLIWQFLGLFSNKGLQIAWSSCGCRILVTNFHVL